jgi:hypothetical protein
MLKDALLAAGEIRTGLLPNSVAVSLDHSTRLLGLLPGQRVRRSERPISCAVSPAAATGVDCLLPTTTGARTRGVGTVLTRATITGGLVLQGSAFTRFVPGEDGRRQPWYHYLARPGIIETLSKASAEPLADGLLAGSASPKHLDLGAISQRSIDQILRHRDLDRGGTFSAMGTRLRWISRHTGAQATIAFAIRNETLRTVQLPIVTDHLEDHLAFCEDLALHDWLLTSLVSLMDNSRIGVGARADVIKRLRPAVDFLLHLWMPGVRVSQAMSGFWQVLELRSGISRQWRINVDRIRDQLALASIEMIAANDHGIKHGNESAPDN